MKCVLESEKLQTKKRKRKIEDHMFSVVGIETGDFETDLNDSIRNRKE